MFRTTFACPNTNSDGVTFATMTLSNGGVPSCPVPSNGSLTVQVG